MSATCDHLGDHFNDDLDIDEEKYDNVEDGDGDDDDLGQLRSSLSVMPSP